MDGSIKSKVGGDTCAQARMAHHRAASCCSTHCALPPAPTHPEPFECPTQAFTEENLEFQQKILARSGLGQHTYLPPGLLKVSGATYHPAEAAAQHLVATGSLPAAGGALASEPLPPPPMRLRPAAHQAINELTMEEAMQRDSPPSYTMEMAREEFEIVMFSTVQDLLDKTGGRGRVGQGGARQGRAGLERG